MSWAGAEVSLSPRGSEAIHISSMLGKFNQGGDVIFHGSVCWLQTCLGPVRPPDDLYLQVVLRDLQGLKGTPAVDPAALRQLQRSLPNKAAVVYSDYICIPSGHFSLQ